MVKVSLDLDTSVFDAKLACARKDIVNIEDRAAQLREKIWLYYQQAQIITNLILQQLKDTAVGQAILTGQQVVMTATSVKLTMAQAEAAAAAGNYVSAGLLTASAITLIGIQTEAMRNQQLAKAHQQQIERYQQAQQTFRSMYV